MMVMPIEGRFEGERPVADQLIIRLVLLNQGRSRMIEAEGCSFITKRVRFWVKLSSKGDREIYRIMDEPSHHGLAIEEEQCNWEIQWFQYKSR